MPLNVIPFQSTSLDVNLNDNQPVTIGAGEVHLWAARLFPAKTIASGDYADLSASELERANRFHFGEHRTKFMQSHLFLRRVLARYTGFSAGEIVFGEGPFGKPAIVKSSSELPVQFNLSHCDDFVLLGITNHEPIGVDVENVRAMPDLAELSCQFFAKAEYEELARVAEPLRDRAFFHCWTRKEAVIKALGSGLSMPLDSFEVTLGVDESAQVVRLKNDPTAHLAWSLLHLELRHDVVGAVAVRFPVIRTFAWLVE